MLLWSGQRDKSYKDMPNRRLPAIVLFSYVISSKRKNELTFANPRLSRITKVYRSFFGLAGPAADGASQSKYSAWNFPNQGRSLALKTADQHGHIVVLRSPSGELIRRPEDHLQSRVRTTRARL